jgi:hypothetical protein
MGLATLIDPDDPDGSPGGDVQVLTTEQLALHPARYREVERASVARELRVLSATITGQPR